MSRKEVRPGFDVAIFEARLRHDGYFICENVFTPGEVEELRQEIAAIRQGDEVRRKQSIYGVRNLLEICPAVGRLAAEPRTRQFVTPTLGEHAFAVRAIFFDKAA